jgi:hypothetical protein
MEDDFMISARIKQLGTDTWVPRKYSANLLGKVLFCLVLQMDESRARVTRLSPVKIDRALDCNFQQTSLL